MRKINKKILLSLSVLATPFVVENLSKENIASANAQYNLTQNVRVYETAQNAEKQTNTSRTYATGTYYVYKEHNGMLNISKTQGKPGSWINPANNKIVAPAITQTSPAQSVQKEQSVSSVSQTAKNNQYILNNDVKVYNTAISAKTQNGSKSTYKSGSYFIYKEFDGMLNISVVAGRAGGWINPADNKSLVVKTTSESNLAQKSAEIKASEPVAVNSTQIEETPTKNAEYILKNRTNVYDTSVDASNSVNSTTTYDKGTYYVYKTYNGMINISRTRGRAGAWINPLLEGVKDVYTLTASRGVAKSMPIASKKYTITSPYGVSRYIPSLGLRDVHDGVDFVTANRKEPILATEDGIVERAGRDVTGAERIIIKHAENSYTGYWHLARNSLTVKPGDFVKAGQQIGIMGTTGWSTGIHLHFMHSTTVNVTKSHKDPMKYLKDVK